MRAKMEEMPDSARRLVDGRCCACESSSSPSAERSDGMWGTQAKACEVAGRAQVDTAHGLSSAAVSDQPSGGVSKP